MKQKLITASLVIFLVLLINLFLNAVIYKRLLPYYWGNDEISDKRQYLLKNKDAYNTIFIGSSKTRYQIIPDLFDERAKEDNIGTRSYNFGVQGLLPLESLHIYENLLLQDSLHLKYAFIELDWIGTVNLANLNVARTFYWLNSTNYLRSVGSIVNSSMPPLRRAWGIFHFSTDYTENVMNVGKVQEYIKFREHLDKQTYSKTDSNVVYDGFIPLKTNTRKAASSLYKEVFSSAKMGVENFNTLKNKRVSDPFLKRLREIIALSRQKGVTPYFVVPLQWKYYQYKELIPVINAIEGEGAKVISLYDIEKYKDVYKREHFADPNHLNAAGAGLYTEELFRSFKSQNSHPDLRDSQAEVSKTKRDF